jgi:hypothetical protein
VSYYYTAFSPTDTAVTVLRRTLDQALDMAAADLARGWRPVHIASSQERFDSYGIVAQLQGRRAKPLFFTEALASALAVQRAAQHLEASPCPS